MGPAPLEAERAAPVGAARAGDSARGELAERAALYAPERGAFTEADVAALGELLRGRRVVALTGAGLSTESGIPDYRGPVTAQRPRSPIQHLDFVRSAATRQRYWARSMRGFPTMAAARPNAAHRALADLERCAELTLCGVLTQNVDGLHQAAGTSRLIELHGAIHRVRCLQCGALEPRAALQERLLRLNAGWPGHEARAASLAPDGDADIDAAALASFTIAPCLACGGVLKPDVVFFGDSVPRPVLDAAWELLAQAEVLLVAGSSLTVYSGFRFVRRAAEQKVPVAIVNLGPTRGDPLAQLRIDARLGDFLPALAARLKAAR